MSYDYMNEYEPNELQALINEFKEKAADVYKEEVKLQAEINTYKKGDLDNKEKRLRQLERELDERQSAIDKQEKNIDVLLGTRLAEILTDFQPQERVFYIVSSTQNHKCPVCGGTYRKSYEKDGNKIEETCGHCSYGNIPKTTYTTKSGTVSDIRIRISMRAEQYGQKWSNVHINIGDNTNHNFYSSPTIYVNGESHEISQLFKTQIDADKECAKRQEESDKKFAEKMGVKNETLHL